MLAGVSRCHFRLCARFGAVQAEFSTPGQQRVLVNEHLNVREARAHPYDADSGYFTSPQGELSFETLAPGAPTGIAEAVPRLWATVEGYHREMQALANKVERCFSLALGLDEHHISSRCAKAPIWPVTIAHYPCQPEPPPPTVQRINAHWDRWDRDLFALVTTNDEDAQLSGCGIQVLLDDNGNTYDAASRSDSIGRW